MEKPAAFLSASGQPPSLDESALAAEEKRQVMRCACARSRARVQVCVCARLGVCPRAGVCLRVRAVVEPARGGRLALARRLKSDMLAEEEKRRYRSREAEVAGLYGAPAVQRVALRFAAPRTWWGGRGSAATALVRVCR